MPTFKDALAACPLVAILRGLKPEEALDIGAALVGAGFTIIEVPLNSPQPLDSIRILADAFGDRALIGAGTVIANVSLFIFQQFVAGATAAGVPYWVPAGTFKSTLPSRVSTRIVAPMAACVKEMVSSEMTSLP